MISKKLVLILSLCVAGSIIPLQASIIDCQADGTLQGVFTAGGACTIGAYTFTFAPLSYRSVESSPGSPVGGVTPGELAITDLLNIHGTGFLLTPTVTMNAHAGGNSDFEIQYAVTGTGINSIYLEVDGNVTANSFDHVVEDYCLGIATPGDVSNTACTGNPPNNTQSTPLNASITSGSAPATASATFANQTAVTVLKDIDANGGPGGGNGDVATITGVINQWGPPVPEPGTYVLSLIGLGLFFLGKRKFTRS